MALPSTLEHDALTRAVVIAEALCALPAVATLDWCDQAATALAPTFDPSVALVVVANLDPRGQILSVEAAGVAEHGKQPEAPASESRIATPNDPESRVRRLRSRAERASELGVVIGEAGLARGAFTTAARATPGDWRGTSIGRLWNGIPAEDVVIAVLPLNPQKPGRSLILEVASTGRSPAGSSTASDVGMSVLRAAAPLLLRRARIAIPDVDGQGAQWLTTREQQVLEELTLGKSVRQIADELERSPHTVHDHVKSLHRKLAASSRGELISRALGHLDKTDRPARQVEVKPTARATTVSLDDSPKLRMVRDEDAD